MASVGLGSIYLFRRDGLLAGLAELLNDLLVVSQILLTANQDEREAGAEVKNLGDPLEMGARVSKSPCVFLTWADGAYLLLNVVKRVGRVDSEADQDNVGVGVGQGSKTVVILLTSRIP